MSSKGKRNNCLYRHTLIVSNSFDLEEFKAQAIEKLKAGVPLSNKDGVLALLLENLLNSTLEGEMDSHLDGGEREMGNRRNGRMSKQIQTSMREITINTPRDRDGTFDPQVVRKREKILADSLVGRIIGLYAIGNSTMEISDILGEQFGNRISAETISSITDRVLPEIQSWKNRPLDRVYPIVWLDAVHYKVMDEKNRPVTRAIYNVQALTYEGRKELLGMYISKSEEANFWLGVLTDLRNRGVQDILIACVDGLKGFPRCDSKCLSSNYGSALHRTPDTQLCQVCCQQEPERVHAGSEARISGGQQRCCRKGT